MTHALISLLSTTMRRGSVRLVARALTTSSQVSQTRLAGVRLQTLATTSSEARRYFSGDRRFSAAVEEDLDAALDEILGDAFKEAKNPVDMEPGTHMKHSRPIPENLVEEENPVDFKDPKFLSTSNPRWVQAGLSSDIIDILSAKGITRFTPVQAEAFDPIMARRDVIGRSRTGTGKTLAFGLPSLTRLVDFMEQSGKRHNGRNRRGRTPSMLVLCPTRELARQVQEEVSEVSRPLGLFVEVFHGGVSYDPQARALRNGVDVVVGTPGRIIDHIERGNLDLSECDIAVLDEADEMLNMGFAEDVEVILEGIGSKNEQKTQCLMFSATTPRWVKEIGKQYQEDVLAIDSTGDEGGARVANTVKHLAVQLPPGVDSKKSVLEDIIAVHISKDEEEEEDLSDNPIAAAAAAKKNNRTHAMQQKIFGKTIVFTQTKREADELVSGSVFKSLTAQALHGDVGQKQRDATLNAFREGAFNVLVATDVAARGIDIKDVDLVIQFDPPRDVDAYVHRSGRTGRAGKSGVSILLFNPQQARDIVRIERDLGSGFKFDLVGPPSTESALKAAAKTSALACEGIPDETAVYFKESAAALLADGQDPEDVIARCLAAISRRSTEVTSRSLITGELGKSTVEMVNTLGRSVAPNDVMFTVGKLARMSRRNGDGDLAFESDVGKIQSNFESGTAVFDMSVEDAKKLVDFSKDIDAGGAVFKILKELEVERGRNFGKSFDRRGGGGGGGRFDRDRNGRSGGGGRYNDSRRFNRDTRHRSNRPGPQSNYHGQNRRADHEGRRYRGGGGGGAGAGAGRDGGFRGRYDNRRNNRNEGW